MNRALIPNVIGVAMLATTGLAAAEGELNNVFLQSARSKLYDCGIFSYATGLVFGRFV